jgi:Family of unknown function (DUF6058)
VPDLKSQIAERFAAVNGEYPMTPADDAYVNKYFVPLSDFCAKNSVSADAIRAHMLANRLPLPSYIRSDGTEMVPADLLALAEQAGGIEHLRGWFASHWADGEEASAEWEAYLSGQNVCLYTVTPANIQRKSYLVDAVSRALAEPLQSASWLQELHGLVDELDQLEPPFAPYDRLRFGGPVSRDTAIDAVRARFPRPEDRLAARPAQSAAGDLA